MSFVINVLTPIIQLVFYLSWTIVILYFVVLFVKKIIKKYMWKIKYKILKKDFNEDDVKLCFDAIEKQMNEIEFKKDLLINKNIPIKKSDELIFIFNELKKMKGGENNVK